MKRPFLFLSFLLLMISFTAPLNAISSKISADCTFKGKRLYGKVQVVENFPDITVQVVENFPELKVKWVNSFPDACGKWQTTTSFPDLKIKFVSSFPDLKIKFVNSFPGIP